MTSVKIPHTDKNTEILCRAQGGEPMACALLSEHPGAIEVATIPDGRTGRFPRIDTYKYDQDLFDRLRIAHEGGRADELSRLWAAAQPLGDSS